jgi:uncharacterized protein
VKVTPEELIRHLNLKPLPVEGGYYSESYRAAEKIPSGALPPRYSSARLFGSAIYYLLTAEPNSFSAIHRLTTDETYHFYLGDPVELLLLYPARRSEHVVLGPDVLGGQQVQFTVPREVWQGSRLVPGGNFALLGTTMAPAFDPADFTAGDRAQLEREYPAQAELIRRLTRE